MITSDWTSMRTSADMRRLLLAALLLTSAVPLHGMTPEECRQYRDKLLQILPNVPSFNAWIEKTNELPPDFDSFPKVNGLPDPLRFLDGRTVHTPQDWEARRTEIRQLFEMYDLGTFPPKPKLDHGVVLDETRGEGYIIRNLRLEFGPGDKGTMRVQLMIPDGRGPFPVLISPNLAGWGPPLLRRGYIRRASPATTAWTTRLRSRNSIRLRFRAASAPGLGGWLGSRLSRNRAAGGYETHRDVRLFARRQDGNDRVRDR